jgi:NAD-dependent dihydropyrimidine dehydrogenase PreA subunit
MLLEFVKNLFTPEEAAIAQYLKMIRGTSAEDVADYSGRPIAEVAAVLSRLADEKRAIFVIEEKDEPREYALMPLAPGTFEQVLMEGKDGEYQRRHGQLFDAIYDTGYMAKIIKNKMPFVRYLPIERTVTASPNILPSDKLSEMLDAAKTFALGFCQCRQAHAFAGKGCGRSFETCVVTDGMADYVISQKIMRKIDRYEAMDVKQRAIEAGCITMSANVKPGMPNAFCSCCSCCCDVLRTITQFNTPGLIAPPHFRPKRNETLCIKCGACVKNCPMKAHVLSDKGWEYRNDRCIGCGICSAKCPKNALAMNEVKDYSPPASSIFGLGLKITPGYMKYLMFD